MATPIKQIKDSADVLHDIQGIEYIVGTQTASTNMWKGVSDSEELYAGKVISYKLPYAGSTNTNTHTGVTTNTTLELTLANGTTVVHPVYRNASTAITTHYPVNSIIRLVFDPTSVTLNGHTFSGSWKTADYDSTTDTKVAQAVTTTNSNLPLILKATSSTTSVTTYVKFNSKLTGNPSVGSINLNTTSITPTASSAITLDLPATGGTLALTSDIPESLPPTAHTHSWGDITNPPSSYTPTAHTHTIGQVYNGNSALSINSVSTNVLMDGTASAGSGSALALANHVHPTDTSRAPINSPAFTGYPTLANAPSVTMGVANKGYVDSVLGGITQVDYQVTTTLPSTGVKGTIYLVGHDHGQGDAYDEYIDTNQNGNWEKIGHTDIDLSNYATVDDLDDKQDKPLVGTTANVTYADMVAAIQAGKDIYITHTDNTYGTFTFTDGWVYSPALQVVGTNGIFNVSNSLTLCQLVVNSSGWSCIYRSLAEESDIPQNVSELNNDTGYITNSDLANAVTPVATSVGANGTATVLTGVKFTSSTTALTSVIATTTSIYPAANVTALTSVTRSTASIYPAANITALTSVTSSTTSIYPAANITAITSVTKSTTTMYGTGTQANVCSSPTVSADGTLSWTLVTVANGTSTTVVTDVTSSGKSVRDTVATVVNAITVPAGKSVRDSATTVVNAVTINTGTSVRGTAVTVATGELTTRTASVGTAVGANGTTTALTGVTVTGTTTVVSRVPLT